LRLNQSIGANRRGGAGSDHPRGPARRVFANRCVPTPPLCSSRFDKRRRRRFGPRGGALQGPV